MTPNRTYPGRPNYEGPVQGIFGLLHHSVLAEWSHNVMERVEYVKKAKPKHEVDIRLWNMCYLSEERVPNEFVEACKIYGEVLKTYMEARKTWGEAQKTWVKAVKTFEETGKNWTEALKTYREAVKTYQEARMTWVEAGKTFEETWKTHREAEKTYNKILQTFSPQILTLIKELVPDTTWNGQELVFPK